MNSPPPDPSPNESEYIIMRSESTIADTTITKISILERFSGSSHTHYNHAVGIEMACYKHLG